MHVQTNLSCPHWTWLLAGMGDVRRRPNTRFEDPKEIKGGSRSGSAGRQGQGRGQATGVGMGVGLGEPRMGKSRGGTSVGSAHSFVSSATDVGTIASVASYEDSYLIHHQEERQQGRSTRRAIKALRRAHEPVIVELLGALFSLFVSSEDGAGYTRARWCCVIAAILLRHLVSLACFSGQDQPPLFGDLEAQRHWMEITWHLPVKMWYFYDLSYWGLDYPPLTAYHSLFFGWLGSIWNPAWFALKESRGIAVQGDLKTYLRWTVILSDLLVFFPAITFFTHSQALSSGGLRTPKARMVAWMTIACAPALLLIDHGHFQYNNVMLGLALLSFSLMAIHGRQSMWWWWMDERMGGSAVLACVFFTAALFFKQMALFYAPVVGMYLLGLAFSVHGRAHGLLLKLGLATLLSTVIFLAPFLLTDEPVTQILQILHRLFPLARGIFEGKVANVWCALHVFYKPLRQYSPQSLSLASLVLTSTAVLPASLLVAFYPNPRGLWPALLNCSIAFFLLGFQIHEKSILLPLLPMLVIMTRAGPNSAAQWQWGVWMNNVALFSIWPLMKQEHIIWQYSILLLCWNYFFSRPLFAEKRSIIKYLSLMTLLVMASLHAAEVIWTPPKQYPDLWAVLNVLFCAPCFGLVWIWSLHRTYLETIVSYSLKTE